jgi:hypothetical protein
MQESSIAQRLAIAALVLSAACRPSAAPETAAVPDGAVESPVAAQRAWWRTFADGDTAALHSRSAAEIALTLSNARTFDRAAMLAESQRFAALPHPTLDWSDTVVVRSSDGNVALVAARLRETDPRGVTYNRTLTVLERAGDVASGWRVLGAQSTREPQKYARLSAAEAGDLAVYAGQYRVPNGILKISLQDSALVLTDPRGTATRLEPVGPALFEAVPPTAVTDVVRILFTRDASGRMSTLSRLAAGGVTTFPRVDVAPAGP